MPISRSISTFPVQFIRCGEVSEWFKEHACPPKADPPLAEKVFEISSLERCPSGLRSTPGKCVYVKSVPRVRIPPSPPVLESVYMCTVYVLRSQKDGHRYIGCAKEFAERLKKHHSGQVKSTKGRRPFDVVYTEELPDWSAARRREDFLKSGQGRKWLDGQNV